MQIRMKQRLCPSVSHYCKEERNKKLDSQTVPDSPLYSNFMHLISFHILKLESRLSILLLGSFFLVSGWESFAGTQM